MDHRSNYCPIGATITPRELISPSRTLCRMLLGLEINLIYVRIALVLNCISLQFSTVDKGIDPTGTGTGPIGTDSFSPDPLPIGAIFARTSLCWARLP